MCILVGASHSTSSGNEGFAVAIRVRVPKYIIDAGNDVEPP